MQKSWFGLAIAGLFIAVWMGRYQVTEVSGGLMALDRWTGDVRVCDLQRCKLFSRQISN